MKTITLIVASLLMLMFSANAQTLFTYGTHAVSKNEFLQAYNKNPDTTGNREQKLKDYFDLYINFRLKLQAAYDEKANNNAELKNETDNFKSQLAENFINQQADLSQLIHKAFIRSQKDILVEQVFVPVTVIDTAAAYKQITKAYKELQAGKNFEDISVEYSNDSAVKAVKGNIGYITVFTLPYSIENIIYNLKPGDFSTVYKSGAGYHIFKNAGERPAMGARKINQLLFNTPSFFNEQQTKGVKQVADSVYHLLQNGTSFSLMLPVYGSNTDNDADNSIEVKVGEYNDDFEKEVFKLKNTGDISEPFKTAYGYNIIKLDAIEPVSNDENDVTYAASLQTQIQNDGRLATAKKNLVSNWLKVTGFKAADYNKNNLWSYTDSAAKTAGQLPENYKGITPATGLFQFTKKKITAKDWINYLEFAGITTDDSKHDYNSLMKDYIYNTCSDYYHEHIEDFDTAATAQIKEFNEANMLFYVMNEHVWQKASEDTAGLQKFYDVHKADYKWQQSVTALVISVQDKNMAVALAEKIKSNPADWRNIVAPFGDKVYSDSSRFDADQLPVKEKIVMEKNYQTQPESSGSGDAYTFVHIINVYPAPEQKSFTDAKGILINDYQQQLEQVWIENLKKVNPVKVDVKVYKTLP